MTVATLSFRAERSAVAESMDPATARRMTKAPLSFRAERSVVAESMDPGTTAAPFVMLREVAASIIVQG